MSTTDWNDHPPQHDGSGQAGHSAPAPSGYSGAPAPSQRKGLAVSALVLGIVALLGCLVPVLNIGSILIALAGVGLGVPALVLARRATHGGKGMAIAGIAMSVVAIVVAVIVNIVAAAAVTSASQAVDQAVQDSENGYSATDEDDAAAAEASALPLGQSAEVGEYTVTVTAVNQNANDVIASANSFNEAPQGQYVLVDLSVVYNGTEEGDPWIDLGQDYMGTDARDYSTSSCSAVVPEASIDQPTLRTGGAADYQVCFDLPAEAIAGGYVAVGESLSLSDTTARWNAA